MSRCVGCVRVEYIEVEGYNQTAWIEVGFGDLTPTPSTFIPLLSLCSSTWSNSVEHFGVQKVQILNGLHGQLQLLIPTGLLVKEVLLTQSPLTFY